MAITKGAELYLAGVPYTEIHDPQTLNEWNREQRDSRCGFHYRNWNKNGRTTGDLIFKGLIRRGVPLSK